MADPTVPLHLRLRARGAGSNASGRFEGETRETFDDGWDMAEEERALDTHVRLEVPRSVSLAAAYAIDGIEVGE